MVLDVLKISRTDKAVMAVQLDAAATRELTNAARAKCEDYAWHLALWRCAAKVAFHTADKAPKRAEFWRLAFANTQRRCAPVDWARVPSLRARRSGGTALHYAYNGVKLPCGNRACRECR